MKYLFSFLFLMSIISCGETRLDNRPNNQETTEALDPHTFYTKEYYFPVENLAEGKVYEYVNVHEGQEYLSHYWLLKSEKDASGNSFLYWDYYNPDFEKKQSIKEWVVKDGVITQAYEFHLFDSVRQSIQPFPNNISQNVVFPFYASTDSVMAYRFECEMKLPPDFLTNKLIRDRKFKQTVKYNYKGEELDAIAFTLTDLYDLENEEEGGFWQIKKGSVEVYAKGIGLVFQEEKTAGQEGSEITRLKNIYSIQEFEALQD